MTETTIKERLKDESFWLRLPFMLLFFIAWRLTELILMGIVLLQLIFRLFKGRSQLQFLTFSSQLTRYSYQIFRYLTFNTEVKPFPFADWPNTEAVDADPYSPNAPVTEDPVSIIEDPAPNGQTVNKS